MKTEAPSAVLVTGSIGIDTVEAPAGRVEDVLGGSAVYFAYAASFFTDVRFVAVAGDDMPEGFLAPLQGQGNIDLKGLEIRAGSRTFRWAGRYHDDVNHRDTLQTQLGVLGEAGPVIPAPFRDSRYVFLANTHPALQAQLLGQLDEPALVVADTMDLWIESERDALEALLGRLDGLVLNDSEARQLTGESNTVVAGQKVARAVKRFVVVKKGEHGCLLLTGGEVYALPAYPCTKVVDPTGAGDSFAGAMMGHLAAVGSVEPKTLLAGMAYGAVVASLELEDFSLNKLRRISRCDIEARFRQFTQMMNIVAIDN
ncbi:MAG: sugar kinase [Planctomycetes bacterium]|nr:sugar kinase [Planctomycetota bacterium]